MTGLSLAGEKNLHQRSPVTWLEVVNSYFAGLFVGAEQHPLQVQCVSLANRRSAMTPGYSDGRCRTLRGTGEIK